MPGTLNISIEAAYYWMKVADQWEDASQRRATDPTIAKAAITASTGADLQIVSGIASICAKRVGCP